MSVLETPRIYFNGQIAWDPIVTNNVDTFYDETTSEPVYPPGTDKVAAFRAAAIKATGVPSILWNPHGTHRSTFYEAAISGADTGAGTVQDDKFVGSPASFVGMLVDLEPYGTVTSQLFFDAMSFGIEGGYRIVAPRTSRMTARYVNFNRNPVGWRAGIASVVWQTSFAKADGLRVDAFDSNALQALQKALDDEDVLGLTVQWNAYRTIYFDTPEIATNKGRLAEVSAALVAKLNGGGFQPNPARSMMVGTIGLWRRGEPTHEPGDRVLVAQGDEAVATAHARLDGDTLTLDLSNSMPETGLDLCKQNFNDLTVSAIDPSTGKPATLGTIPYGQYDAGAYLRSSGIVTLRKIENAALAATADLQLSDATPTVLLLESALRAVPLEPNVYVDEGSTLTAVFQVYDRGVPAGAGIAVEICVMSADGSTVESHSSLTTEADGTVSFAVPTATAGITPYVAVPGPNPALPTQGIDPQVNTFLYVRVLSADADVAALPPTWDNVYSRVLSNWKAMAPCMDNWLDLANEAQVRSFGPLLRKLTAGSAIENFRYMPVTRDLTAGERTLLYNFLGDAQPKAAAAKMLSVEAPAAQPLTAEGAAEPATAEGAEFAKKNRSMRGGD